MFGIKPPLRKNLPSPINAENNSEQPAAPTRHIGPAPQRSNQQIRPYAL